MPTSAEYIRVLPEIILTLAGVLIMFLEAVLKDRQKGILTVITILGLGGAVAGAIMANGNPGLAFHDMIVVDGFATFFRVLVILVGLLAVLASTEYLHRENAGTGEFF